MLDIRVASLYAELCTTDDIITIVAPLAILVRMGLVQEGIVWVRKRLCRVAPQRWRSKRDGALEEIAVEVQTVDGQLPKQHTLQNAVRRVDAQQDDDVPGGWGAHIATRSPSSQKIISHRTLKLLSNGDTSGSARATTSYPSSNSP